MPEYLHPGVYVEEVDAGPKPIEGVSTSTAGAVGVTERGPTDGGPPYFGKPVLCTSFADFERVFGTFLEEPPPSDRNRWDLDSAEGGRWWQFPVTIKGFFGNGGQRIYVKRAFSSTAIAISIGPSVINRKSSEGGYLVVFRNDSTVKIAVGCAAQREGSP